MRSQGLKTGVDMAASGGSREICGAGAEGWKILKRGCAVLEDRYHRGQTAV